MGERSREEMENRDRMEADAARDAGDQALTQAIRRLDDEEVEALADRVAQLPPEEKIDFLLGMLHRVESERNQFRIAATDTWCALFAADRVADRVELLSAEHAAMLPGTMRAAFAAANEVRRTLEDKVAGWRQENDRHRALYVEAVKERDRLWPVVDATRLIRRLVENDAPLDGPECTAAVDAFDAALDALGWETADGELDGSPVMGVVDPTPAHAGRDAWVWTCACGTQTALTRCSTCGWTRPMPPIDRHEAFAMDAESYEVPDD